MTESLPVPIRVQVRALMIGQRLNLRPLQRSEVVGTGPLAVDVTGGGLAILFRFGVVVLYDVMPVEEVAFLGHLTAFVTDPIEHGECEELTLRIMPDAKEGFVENELIVPSRDLPTLQAVAHVLAKAVLLEDYERRVGETFDRIEPLAERMRHGRGVRQARGLVRHIGETLLTQHRMVGRAEVGEKPDILWERPDLERLYARLEQEYEIRERQVALDRKIQLIGQTAETLLDLLQSQRTLRVEWYIVILIVVEIVLTLYEMFIRH